eukprot:15106001-Alexandrium_andersonii.AAC.1
MMVISSMDPGFLQMSCFRRHPYVGAGSLIAPLRGVPGSGRPPVGVGVGVGAGAGGGAGAGVA